MTKQQKLVTIILKDKVTQTTLDIVLASMDLAYLDGRQDERQGKNLDYIQK